jgi:hypothetical protein
MQVSEVNPVAAAEQVRTLVGELERKLDARVVSVDIDTVREVRLFASLRPIDLLQVHWQH